MTTVQGFAVWTAEATKGSYEIIGDDMQLVNLSLKPGEFVTAEPGSMSFMSDNIKTSVNCDSCFKRCMGNNPCIMTVFTNDGNSDGYIALSPSLPAKVIPLENSMIEGRMRCKSGTYLAHIGEVDLNFDVDCCSLTCCFGGQGCVRQSLGGTGTSFVSAMGTILKKTLTEGEVLVVDTNSVVAWQDSVVLGIKAVGGCCTCCCGGEGMFNTTLTGPGDVYIQSYSREKFGAALMMIAQTQGGGGGGAGGAPAVADEMTR